MTRAALALVAACDLGLGTDPSSGPRSACAPGHARLDDHSGCFVPQVAITIDGEVVDWSTLSPIALAATCAGPPCDGLLPTTAWLAAGTKTDTNADLRVRGSFGTAPPADSDSLRVALVVSASPIRPATAGSDRLVATGSTLSYDKSGFAPTTTPYAWQWTADGFEAELDGDWLTYQGAARVAIAVERSTANGWVSVAASTPIDACWGFRSGSDALPATACEVLSR